MFGDFEDAIRRKVDVSESGMSADKENCGWDLKVADDLEKIDPPTLEELRSARIFGPHGFFLGT